MAEHHARIEIRRPAGDVFAALANPMNLPRWQPTLRESFREGPDRIRAISGGLGGEGIAMHVRFAADPDTRQLSWATAAGVGCAGDLQVEDTPQGATVELRLRLGARAETPDAASRWTGDTALDIDGALHASLQAAKALCEDTTTTVQLVSGGTQDDPSQAPLADSRPYGTSATQNPDAS